MLSVFVVLHGIVDFVDPFGVLDTRGGIVGVEESSGVGLERRSGNTVLVAEPIERSCNYLPSERNRINLICLIKEA
jgi:hypothetical protein